MLKSSLLFKKNTNLTGEQLENSYEFEGMGKFHICISVLLKVTIEKN